MLRRRLHQQRATVLALVWALLVTAALAATLRSLDREDFDGLNNIWQIPFALPWFVVPIGTSDHVFDAWVAAAMGWGNARIVKLARVA